MDIQVSQSICKYAVILQSYVQQCHIKTTQEKTE